MKRMRWMRPGAMALAVLGLALGCAVPAAASEAFSQEPPAVQEPVDQDPATEGTQPGGLIQEEPAKEPQEDPPKEPEEGTQGDPPKEPEEGTQGDPPKEPEEGTQGDPPEKPAEDSQEESESEAPVLGGTQNPPEEGAQESAASHHVTLAGQTIRDSLSYTVVSAQFAGQDLPEGYYAGDLTVELTGDVVVADGGSLSLGKLSSGSPDPSPVLTGSGTITVENGGSLKLTDVTLEGELRIIQKDGGSVLLTGIEAPASVFTWGAPLVDNQYDAPEDLWLEAGTPLTEDLLPKTLSANLQVQGWETRQDLDVTWDLEDCAQQTDSQCTITGQFLDETGATLASMVPLTLTVHWYTAKTLPVHSAVWKGDTVPLVQITLEWLPEEADVWGEVSSDGKTWTRWDDFFVVSVEPDGYACFFDLPDSTPRWFRVAAEDRLTSDRYQSEALYLGPEGTEEDSGGNRGGSIAPTSPSREPTPPEEQTPAETVPALEAQGPSQDVGVLEAPPENQTAPAADDAQEASAPAGSAPAAEPAEEPAQEPAAETPSADTPEDAGTAAAPVPDTAAENGPAEEAPDAAPELQTEEPSAVQPEQAASLPLPARIALVAAGAAACAAAGLAAAGAGPFRKWRKKS